MAARPAAGGGAGGGARRVLDLGCGDGDLLIRLLAEQQITRIVGIDLSQAALDRLRARLDRGPRPPGPQVDLWCRSMTVPDPRLCGFDCAVLVQTIEHLAPDVLSALEAAVFDSMRPCQVVVTTPNAEFNPLPGVPRQRMRHPGHRFEWGREKFGHWARGVGARHGYGCARQDIDGRHPTCGGASQMAVCTLVKAPDPTPPATPAPRAP